MTNLFNLQMLRFNFFPSVKIVSLKCFLRSKYTSKYVKLLELKSSVEDKFNKIVFSGVLTTISYLHQLKLLAISDGLSFSSIESSRKFGLTVGSD